MVYSLDVISQWFTVHHNVMYFIDFYQMQNTQYLLQRIADIYLRF